VGLGIMGYNYWRFQNPFDFGATYNLTGFDMTHVNKSPVKLLLGYFSYFIQPFNVINHFPFMKVSIPLMNFISNYQGKIINEEFLGSFFSLNLIALTVFWLFSIKETMKIQETYDLAICSFLAAFLVISVDILIVGITQRYLCDFGLFVMISDILFLLTVLDKTYHKRFFKQVLSVIIVLSFLCIIINYLSLFAIGTRGYTGIMNNYPQLYYLVKYSLFVI
jgi:hypothetical protein